MMYDIFFLAKQQLRVKTYVITWVPKKKKKLKNLYFCSWHGSAVLSLNGSASAATYR